MESGVEDGSLSARQNAQAGHMDPSEYSGEHKPALFGRLSSPGVWRVRGLGGTAEGLGPHAAEPPDHLPASPLMLAARPPPEPDGASGHMGHHSPA